MPMSATHTGPPPGYMTLDEVAAALDISRQRLGAASVLGLLDSWKLPGSRARLFRAADVAEIANWRRTRQGLIALGRLSPTSRAWPDSLLAARNFNGEDYHGCDCPLCDRAAVYDPLHEEAGTWCPEHGVVPAGDYPPTPRQAALMAEYEGQEWGDAP